MSIMNVNYMTKTYNHFLRGQETDENSVKGMAEVITEKLAGNEKIGETVETRAVFPKDMTMEEYKQYIYGKISEIPMHPSRMQESISITISEAGFEAMKSDPEYEAWVLNDLRMGWAQPDRWADVCGGAYSTIYYGATKEECHAEMWSAGYQNGSGKSLFDSKAKDNFWERRVEQKKRIEEQNKDQQEKKILAKKLVQEQYLEELSEKRETNSELLKSWNNERLLAKAFNAYDANVMTETVTDSDYFTALNDREVAPKI